jgi:hypothetical protein
MSNKFLSLDWFKQTAENAIAKVIANKLESIMEQEQEVLIMILIKKCLRNHISQ